MIAVVVGVCMGIASGALHASGVSLLVLQPVATGVLVGILLIGGTATLQLSPPSRLVTLLAGAVAVATQHVWIHREVMAGRRDAIAKQPGAELFKPGWSEQSLWAYLRHEADLLTASLWALDACLLIAAAVVIVGIVRNRSASVVNASTV